MSLRQRAVSGVLWNFLQRLSTSGIGLLVTLLLARVLAPSDFGLMAMIAVFVAVATSLMDSGFTQALIRKPDAGPQDFTTAFVANLFLGVLAYALLFLVAPAVADFYDQPVLVDLLRVVGLVVPLNATMAVQVAILSRKLDFKKQLRATIPATLISGVLAILLACAGWGVWALVMQLLLASAITSTIYWASNIWRPEPVFSGKSLRELYGFGSRIFAAGIIDTVFVNLYIVVIARMFSATAAGNYFFATKIKDLILSQLVVAVQTVTYPALASIQHDGARLKDGYRQVIQVTVFILFPTLLLAAALAEPLFDVLLPDKWRPAIAYFQLLCIAGLLFPLHTINLEILKVKGRSDLFLYIDIGKKLVLVGVLAISYRYGIVGIIVGQIICSVLAYLPNSYFSSRLVGYAVPEQLADFVPSLALASVVAAAAYAAGRWLPLPPLLTVLSVGGLSLAIYIGLAAWLRMPALTLALQIIRRHRLPAVGP